MTTVFTGTDVEACLLLQIDTGGGTRGDAAAESTDQVAEVQLTRRRLLAQHRFLQDGCALRGPRQLPRGPHHLTISGRLAAEARPVPPTFEAREQQRSAGIAIGVADRDCVRDRGGATAPLAAWSDGG